MTVNELKKKIEEYERSLQESSGQRVAFSVNGPANMGLIKALFAVVERQQREIDELKAKAR